MTRLDVVLTRLRTQHLASPRLARPADAVRWLGCAQSQDYPGAKWSIGQRVRACTDADVDRAFAEGAILRTHILRPTWHFVAPADIRWIQRLTAPRVHAQNAYYYRRLEVDAPVVKRSQSVFARALEGGKSLTREELAGALERSGIRAAGTRLGYIVIRAELDGLICSGPLRGKRHTYMLLDERAPRAKELRREEALATLTERYFTSHGPATIRDFVWWSSLSVADAKAGLEMVKDRLRRESVEDRTYWYASRPASPRAAPVARGAPVAYLLPEYDESTIAYQDLRVLLPDPRTVRRRNAFGLLVRPVVIDGITVGTWTRTIERGRLVIAARPFLSLGPAETKALEAAAARFGSFLAMPAQLVTSRAA